MSLYISVHRLLAEGQVVPVFSLCSIEIIEEEGVERLAGSHSLARHAHLNRVCVVILVHPEVVNFTDHSVLALHSDKADILWC